MQEVLASSGVDTLANDDGALIAVNFYAFGFAGAFSCQV